jgi:hypothetical protein
MHSLVHRSGCSYQPSRAHVLGCRTLPGLHSRVATLASTYHGNKTYIRTSTENLHIAVRCLQQRDESLAAFNVEAARLPTQAETLFTGTDNAEDIITRVQVADPDKKTVSDLDYLSVRHARFDTRNTRTDVCFATCWALARI